MSSSEIKWIKISTSIFDDEKIQLFEAMPDADALLVIWFKLLVLTGKVNATGDIQLLDGIPYTDEMLATVFHRPLNTVRMAMGLFQKYRMIEITDGIISVINWEKYQNIEGMELVRLQNATRAKTYRERRKLRQSQQPKLLSEAKSEDKPKNNVSVTLRHGTDVDVDIDIKSNNTHIGEELNIYNSFEKYAKQSLTPMISEELKDAEQEYGAEIVVAAFKAASAHGKFGGYFLKYCQPIFEQYKSQDIPEKRNNGGNHNGKHQGSIKKLESTDELINGTEQFIASHPKRAI